MTIPESHQGGESNQSFEMPNPRLYRVVHSCVRPIMQMLGTKVEGQEYVNELDPDTGTMLVVSHSSYLDETALTMLNFPSEMRHIGKLELNYTPFIGWLGRQFGAVWVDRNDRDSTNATMDSTVGLLNAGAWVVNHPEATRNKSSDRRSLLDFKSGFARAALRAEGITPILPIAVGYRAGRRRLSSFGAGVVAGKPLFISKGEGDKDEIRDEVYRNMSELKNRAVDLAETRG